MMVRVLLEPFPRKQRRQSSAGLNWLRYSLLCIGLVLLSYTAYIYFDAAIFQAHEEQILDAGVSAPESSSAKDTRKPNRSVGADGVALEPSLIGRISISRLNVKAIIREGTDSKTLRRAVGHVTGTALPGEDGNIGLAGHRDSFFRGLRDVRKDDVITVQTFDREFEYKVDSLQIVGPKDVQVLAPTNQPILTLVTCYPFQYLGNAPRRFIVRAKQIAVTPRVAQGS